MQNHSTQKPEINPNFLKDIKTFRDELERQIPKLNIHIGNLYLHIKTIKEMIKNDKKRL